MLRWQVPRFQHLQLILLSYGMIKLSARHLTTLLLSGLVAINLWPLFALPLWAHLVCVGFPVLLLLLPFGWISIGGRPLEIWLLVLLRYWTQPRIYVWQQPMPSKNKNPSASRRKLATASSKGSGGKEK